MRPDPDAEHARSLDFLRAGSTTLTYLGRDGAVLGMNDAGLRHLGLPREQVLGRSIFDLIPTMPAEVRGRVERVFDTRQTVVASEEVLLPTGVRHFESCLDPIFDAAGAVIGVVVQSREVTAEHAVATSLVEANQKLSAIFAHSPYLILTYTRNGTITYINRVGPGFTFEQVIGTDSHHFVSPEFHPRYDEVLSEVFDAGKTATFEFLDVNGSWWEATLGPMKTAGGPEQAISFSVDITERRRKEQEQARIEQQMQHTQKLESLGVLAGGIAHDFNNLLLVITANTDLALKVIAAGSPARANLNDVLAASAAAADLCRQMLAYAGRGQLVVERLDLSRCVAQMAQLVAVSVSKGVELERDLAPGLPAIEADPSQLSQVVLNLITNASEAIGDHQGTISVSTRLVRLDDRGVSGSFVSQPLAPGEYLVLAVSDTGVGIDDATRARMFEPFFSTKASGRGLGLSATLGIIHQHRGAIVVDSTPGKGTTIRALFPAAGGGSPRAEPREQAAGVAGRGLVLVVDDEPAVRRVATHALRDAGYEVLAATNGQEALECLARYRDGVRLVLLDLTMPGLSGQDTLRVLRRDAPTLPVIIMSGYSDASVRDDHVRFLAKPFHVGELIGAVGELLAAPATPPVP